MNGVERLSFPRHNGIGEAMLKDVVTWRKVVAQESVALSQL